MEEKDNSHPPDIVGWSFVSVHYKNNQAIEEIQCPHCKQTFFWDPRLDRVLKKICPHCGHKHS